METIISNCIFGYQCEKSWEELPGKDDSTVKHCNKCQKDVFFCETPEQLMQAIRAGLCVAVDKVVDSKKIKVLGYPSGNNLPSFLKENTKLTS